jgi:hypothetical protein
VGRYGARLELIAAASNPIGLELIAAGVVLGDARAGQPISACRRPQPSHALAAHRGIPTRTADRPSKEGATPHCETARYAVRLSRPSKEAAQTKLGGCAGHVRRLSNPSKEGTKAGLGGPPQDTGRFRCIPGASGIPSLGNLVFSRIPVLLGDQVTDKSRSSRRVLLGYRVKSMRIRPVRSSDPSSILTKYSFSTSESAIFGKCACRHVIRPVRPVGSSTD